MIMAHDGTQGYLVHLLCITVLHAAQSTFMQ